MDKKELDIELNKIHENPSGDEIYIPDSLVEEIFGRMIKEATEKHTK